MTAGTQGRWANDGGLAVRYSIDAAPQALRGRIEVAGRRRRNDAISAESWSARWSVMRSKRVGSSRDYERRMPCRARSLRAAT